MNYTNKKGVILLIAILALAVCVSAQTRIVRGPYLQMGSETSVTVMWRTDWPASSQIWYGDESGKFEKSVSDPAEKIDHVLHIDKLKTNTKYFYKLGTTESVVLAGDDEEHTFVTSPPIGSRVPVRLWILGDSGTANLDSWAVKQSYLELAKKEAREADIWLMLGDNAYFSGTQWEYQRAVFDMYPELLKNKVLWSTRGNHDEVDEQSNPQTGPYFDIFHLPTKGESGGVASGTERYYSFDYANIHFICLDSDTKGDNAKPGSAMLMWLEEDLANTQQDWIVAFWHHPPYTKGSHDSDREQQLIDIRENALPILEAGGVDLVLGGHSHAYERSYLIDGHYGKSDTFDASVHLVDGGSGREDVDGPYTKPKNTAHKGAVYVVAGSSGKISDSPFGHPTMFKERKKLGSLVIDVDGDRLDVRFLREKWMDLDIDDYFTLIKKDSLRQQPPQIVMQQPRSDTQFVSPANITLSAEASGDVSKVIFYQNGKKLGEDLESPYEWQVSSLLPGTYKFQTRAQNSERVLGQADAITVDIAPTGKEQTLVAKESQWKYFDKGFSPAQNWQQSDYDDSAWLKGLAQFGYEDGDENTLVDFGGNPTDKHPTAYFRKEFTVENAKNFEYLILSLLQDDGAVVYLNSKEIHRVNMPEGSITYESHSARAVIDRTFVKTMIANSLVDGRNVIAAEVHQSCAKAWAMSFDLELIGKRK